MSWAVLARLRKRVQAGGLVRTAHARNHIYAAVRFLAWVRARGGRLGDVVQPDLEAWLDETSPSSYYVRDFLTWAHQRKLVAKLVLPVLTAQEGRALDDEQRWSIVERLLHDDQVELTDRVAGCLVLLYGQQLTRVLLIKVDQIKQTDEEITLRIGTDDIPLPQPLGGLVINLIATGRRYVGVGSPGTTVWLFPGHLPGCHLTPARLGERLRKLGIRAQEGRRGALMHLAKHMPAAVLADLLNITASTAVRWVRAGGGDWSFYAAEVARSRGRGSV